MGKVSTALPLEDFKVNLTSLFQEDLRVVLS